MNIAICYGFSHLKKILPRLHVNSPKVSGPGLLWQLSFLPMRLPSLGQYICPRSCQVSDDGKRENKSKVSSLNFKDINGCCIFTFCSYTIGWNLAMSRCKRGWESIGQLWAQTKQGREEKVSNWRKQMENGYWKKMNSVVFSTLPHFFQAFTQMSTLNEVLYNYSI